MQAITPYLLYEDGDGCSDPQGHDWFFAQPIEA